MQDLERLLEIERLGANVGDVVRIVRVGSGGWKRGFTPMDPHVITKITAAGNVFFDEGEAIMYRPRVEIIKKGAGLQHERTHDCVVSM